MEGGLERAAVGRDVAERASIAELKKLLVIWYIFWNEINSTYLSNNQIRSALRNKAPVTSHGLFFDEYINKSISV